ncbi:NUDIX hydrolase domain-like protein [Sparassis latifolia]
MSSERLDEVARGGVPDWLPFSKIKLYTNAFVRQDGKLLLGYKKRGFGKDLYNGFGGKVEPGETPAQAALRELEEESGIAAPLEHCGVLFFVLPDLEQAFHIDIFRAEEYSGTITESDEMRPQWFDTEPAYATPNAKPAAADGSPKEHNTGLPPIPYDQMWADDPFWLPLMLAGRHFAGRADFGSDGRLQKWWFGAKPV